MFYTEKMPAAAVAKKIDVRNTACWFGKTLIISLLSPFVFWAVIITAILFVDALSGAGATLDIIRFVGTLDSKDIEVLSRFATLSCWGISVFAGASRFYSLLVSRFINKIRDDWGVVYFFNNTINISAKTLRLINFGLLAFPVICFIILSFSSSSPTSVARSGEETERVSINAVGSIFKSGKVEVTLVGQNSYQGSFPDSYGKIARN